MTTAARAIALTFDDGPGGDDAVTAAILRANGAKGTFFEVADRFDGMPARIREMRSLQAQGMEIGAHGWTHRGSHVMGAADAAVCAGQVTQMDRAFEKALGRRPSWFRAEGFVISRPGLAVVSRSGYRYAGPGICLGEGGNPRTAAIELLDTFQLVLDRKERAGGRNGASGWVFVMHSAAPGVNVALADMVRYAHSRGYRLVTLSELGRVQLASDR